jgi:TRAP-type C4-dicarboxylate transport system permease small subunit
MKTFDKVLGSITEKIAWIAQAAMVACMILVVSDVIKRIFTTGIYGVIELVEFIAGIILSMGIGYLTFVRGHVAVDVMVMRLRPRLRAVTELIVSVMALGITILLTRGMFDFAAWIDTSGQVTGVLAIPIYPFVYLVAGSLALTCVVLVRDLVSAAINVIKTGGAK